MSIRVLEINNNKWKYMTFIGQISFSKLFLVVYAKYYFDRHILISRKLQIKQ